jgi:hypothetical protein
MGLRSLVFPFLLLYAMDFPGCATATPPPPTPPQQHVKVSLWMDSLTLGPGQSKTWFHDDVPQDAVRTFTAVPIGFTGIDQPFAQNDQIVEVTNVFNILKGDVHATDGSGGQRTLQVNVTVKNRDPQRAATFRVYQAEFR